jgi:hypothetical protein
VAYLVAKTDAEAAAKIAVEHGGGNSYTANGLAWAAMQVAQKDKAAGHKLIDQAFRSIHDRAPNATGFGFFGGWGEAAGLVSNIAHAIDYPYRADFAAHIFAERPTEQDAFTEAQVLGACVGLAALLAPMDRVAAKTLLDISDRRRDAIGSAGGRIRGDREMLTAWGLIDPVQAAPMLLAEVEKQKASGRALSEHAGILEALDIMTAPPTYRLQRLAQRFGNGWPMGDLDR